MLFETMFWKLELRRNYKIKDADSILTLLIRTLKLLRNTLKRGRLYMQSAAI